MNSEEIFNTDEIIALIKKYNLTKTEMRRCLRKGATMLYQRQQLAINKGWGIKTGRLSREGLKLGISKRDEGVAGAAYKISFSKKKGKRGTPEYMADTFKARWLEGGTRSHFTVRGATIKKQRKGRLSLNSHQRKLMHPGFAAKRVVAPTVSRNRNEVIQIVRAEIIKLLIKKGAQDGNSRTDN